MEPIGRLRHTEPPALCSALLFHHGLLDQDASPRRVDFWSDQCVARASNKTRESLTGHK